MLAALRMRGKANDGWKLLTWLHGVKLGLYGANKKLRSRYNRENILHFYYVIYF